jgi:hypothetical protein
MRSSCSAPQNIKSEQNDHADRQVEDLVKRDASVIARVVVPVGEILLGLAEEERADEAAKHEEHAVNFAGRSGSQGGGRAEPADDEAGAHDKPAEKSGPQVRRIDPNLTKIEESQPDSAKK